jgi:DNA recombination protein RmuC
MEYESQPGHRDSEQKLFKPDIVIHLPGDRDVIIDSKVSLFDYEKYTSGTDKEEQDYYLKKHIKAMKTHIRGLSGKDYSDLDGIKSLDFILMFVPIEGAFAAAFQNDSGLFDYSYKNKIIVTAPTTLMATLKTIENIWKFEYQNRNTMVIAEKAGIVYDKLRGFVDDMEKLGKQMNTANSTYNDAFNKLSKGRGNLVDQANEFIELGVKVKRKIQIN